MSKIFPFRRLNPTKGRLDPPSVQAKQSSLEDKRILRELQREATRASLARRAARLKPSERPDLLLKLTLDFLEPEFVQAFESLPRSARLTLLAREPDKHRPVQAAVSWLNAYGKRAPARCEGCGIDITISQIGALLNDRVPYEIVVIGPPYHVAGLCEDCFKLPFQEKADKILFRQKED